MPTEQSILSRLEALETTVQTLASTTSVDLKIASVNDAIGPILSDLAVINDKLNNIMIPEDTRYYLSQDEINFLRDSMKKVSKQMVELEALKDELLRVAQSAL
tara:strand:+ start:2777 stop:3085 length:309 start_codon:yes stop_codon:yes gene_type:complete